jgi:hypothetical protein
VKQCYVIFFIDTMLIYFLIAIVLSCSSLMQHSVIPRYYSAQSFSTDTASVIHRVTTRAGGGSVGGGMHAGGSSQLSCGVRDRATQSVWHRAMRGVGQAGDLIGWFNRWV